MLLDGGEYATFNQVKAAGGRIKKEELKKSHIVVFWKWIEKEDKEGDKKEKFPLLRYYRVFEINTQCEGLQSKQKTETFEHNPIEAAEKIKAEYINAPSYSYNWGSVRKVRIYNVKEIKI